ncbi:MAG: helix-turn-helix domain-containing protein [Coriobacteriaceae bacterium]|nr:helix-turn-helix domain-containing protein [Coriobacteriaceae bacterium]
MNNDKSTFAVLERRHGATLSPDELAFESGAHPVRIREMCRDGRIHAVKIGSRWRIPLAAAAAFLEGDESHE